MTLKEHLASGPFTLALSSGFFGFFAHCGTALALHEAGLTPARFTGSSAGAIIAAAWSHGVTPKELELVLRTLKKADFWDPGLGLGLLKGGKIESLVRDILGDRSRVGDLRISLFDILSRRTVSFAEGDVAKLVRASVAVPLMFHPVRIGRRMYWDGGILDKMAVFGLPADERVFVHYLEGRNVHSLYERRRGLDGLASAHTAMLISDMPAVSPDALSRGQDALEFAREATHRALQSEHKHILII